MTMVTRNERIYFGAVGLLALWVGIWGYFIPEHVDKAIPWLVPPFHARFIGAIYLSAVIIMSGSILARSYFEVRAAVIMIGIWTGALFVISLFYLNEFDFSRGQVLFWFGAYIIYPVVAFWLTWIHRNTHEESNEPNLAKWILNYFLIQGILVTALALTLLLIPNFMITIWPWKITVMLAQIYSGPFLAYGLGGLVLSRQRTWSGVHIVAMGSFVLAIGVLIASFIHRTLFSASSLSTLIWFGGFALAALLLAIIILRNINAGESK